MRVQLGVLATLPILCSAGVALAQAAYVPGAALVNPAISGNTDYDGWIGLASGNYPGYGGFPGTGAWPAAIGSNRTLDNTFNASEPGDAGFTKLSSGIGGGAFPAGSSIYFGGFSADINYYGGTLAVFDETPVANLQNVIFQIQIGEAWGYDFYDGLLPTLSFNGGEQQLEAGYSTIVEQFYNGTVEMPTGPEDVFINTYLLQWDLSGIDVDITDFSISFAGVQHAQIYSLRLDQSDLFTAVPTPGSLALFGLGSLLMARRRR